MGLWLQLGEWILAISSSALMMLCSMFTVVRFPLHRSCGTYGHCQTCSEDNPLICYIFLFVCGMIPMKVSENINWFRMRKRSQRQGELRYIRVVYLFVVLSLLCALEAKHLSTCTATSCVLFQFLKWKLFSEVFFFFFAFHGLNLVVLDFVTSLLYWCYVALSFSLELLLLLMEFFLYFVELT